MRARTDRGKKNRRARNRRMREAQTSLGLSRVPPHERGGGGGVGGGKRNKANFLSICLFFYSIEDATETNNNSNVTGKRLILSSSECLQTAQCKTKSSNCKLHIEGKRQTTRSRPAV